MKKTTLSILLLTVIAAVVSCLSYSPGYSDANGFGRGELSFRDARKAVKAAQEYLSSSIPDGCQAFVIENTCFDDRVKSCDSVPGLCARYKAMRFRARVEHPDRTLEVREFTLYFTDDLSFWDDSEAAVVEEALARQQKRPRI